MRREKIAIISATGFGKVESEDTNENTIPDVLEASRLIQDQNATNKDFTAKLADIQSKNRQFDGKMAIEQEKLKVARENMKNDLEVEKLRAKNRNNKKS